MNTLLSMSPNARLILSIAAPLVGFALIWQASASTPRHIREFRPLRTLILLLGCLAFGIPGAIYAIVAKHPLPGKLLTLASVMMTVGSPALVEQVRRTVYGPPQPIKNPERRETGA